MSVFKKGTSIIKSGITPVLEGRKNMKAGTMEAEAKERAKVCGGCPENVHEPISFFRIVDEENPEISDRMCDNCGCSIPLLVRQNLKICKHWKE